MPSPSSRKVHRDTQPQLPKKNATLAQFRIWPPKRQKAWLTAMNTEKARDALNPDQLQTLTQAQIVFDRGM